MPSESMPVRDAEYNAPCVSTTPLGCPVVPLVYTIVATSLADTSAQTNAAPGAPVDASLRNVANEIAPAAADAPGAASATSSRSTTSASCGSDDAISAM